jgi:putative CocE/NonD family hydrolase
MRESEEKSMTAETRRTPRERMLEANKQRAETTMPVAEVGIPMRDGLELAADIYFPEASQLPAPVVVTMTPYDKSRGSTEDEARYYQKHGYVFIAVDCRGRGKSEGEWRSFVNDGRDGHDTVEWAASQSWSTGKIGITGLSYSGWVVWATAAELPEHLTALVSTSPAGRWMREIPYTDGCFQLFFGWWVYMVRRRIIEGYGRNQIDWNEVLGTLPLDKIGEFINPTGQSWRDFMDHDTLDDFWKSMRFDGRYGEFNYPCLHVTGWYDMEDLQGAFHHYELMAANSPANANQFLIAGPWSHGGSRYPHHSYAELSFGQEAALEMSDVHLRWFDYWLKGIENGVLGDVRVKLWRGGANEWVASDHWPMAEREESLFLRFDGESAGLEVEPKPAPEEAQSFRYDPLDPVPTRIDIKTYAVEEVPVVMNELEERGDVLTYTSAPLEGELEISGWPHLELFAASDCDDTEWHVRLNDVDPEGRSVKVCQGCLRASYRDSLEQPTPLTPGEIHRFDVELWPVHHVFRPGHRVRVMITSSDFPWFARSMNRFGPLKDQAEPRVATNTVHHGAPHASRIRLPVRQGQLPTDNGE